MVVLQGVQEGQKHPCKIIFKDVVGFDIFGKSAASAYIIGVW
jgi:hypothetical protein